MKYILTEKEAFMNSTLKLLFGELNKYWCNSNSLERTMGNPVYSNVQKKILNEIAAMSTQTVIGFIDELSDAHINQIVPIVEDIIKLHPQTKHIFKSINEERNIYCLDNELKTLGII